MLGQYEQQIQQLPADLQATYRRAFQLLAGAILAEQPRTVAAFVGEEAAGQRSIRLRNRSRLELLAQRVREQSVRGSELRSQLGVSRQRLQQLRDQRRLLGVRPPFTTEFWYPRWQFLADGEPHPLLGRLLATGAKAELSPLQLHLLVTNPAAGVDGQPLVELLDSDPEQVLEVVAGAGELGS